MKSLRLITFLLVSCAAQAASLRIVSVRFSDNSVPATVHVFCTTDYPKQACVEDAAALRTTLARYPLDRLDDWSFVLSPSGDVWKTLVQTMGGNTASPAFTVLDDRLTVFERALFSAEMSRRVELTRTFAVRQDELLPLAVSHELGHILCHDLDEKHADAFGAQLRANSRPAVCLSLPSRPVLTTEMPRLRIRVKNDAGVEQKTVLKAEQIAGKALTEAHVSIDWTNCDISADVCSTPLNPPEIVIFLIRNAASGSAPKQDVFGSAFVPSDGSPGNYIYVFGERLQRLAAEHSPLEIETILGHVIAHELGHLLLGLKAHSSSGIMQPSWSSSQIKQAQQGLLRFDPAQARRIEEAVRVRNAGVSTALASNKP